MRDFLAWLLLFSVVAMWVITPYRQATVWRLFGVESDEELFRRFGENWRWLASIGLVLLTDVVAVALALVLLL